MNRNETAALIGIATAADPRMGGDETTLQARAIMWSEAIHPDITLVFARRAIARFYADNTRSIMPADINHAWLDERRDIAERQRSSALQRQMALAEAEAVPMPDNVRQIVDYLKGKTA